MAELPLVPADADEPAVPAVAEDPEEPLPPEVPDVPLPPVAPSRFVVQDANVPEPIILVTCTDKAPVPLLYAETFPMKYPEMLFETIILCPIVYPSPVDVVRLVVPPTVNVDRFIDVVDVPI